jgi:hypothetical protein
VNVVEQVFSRYIFDGDNALKGETLRLYLTINDIERMIEGEYE